MTNCRLHAPYRISARRAGSSVAMPGNAVSDLNGRVLIGEGSSFSAKTNGITVQTWPCDNDDVRHDEALEEPEIPSDASLDVVQWPFRSSHKVFMGR